MLRAENATRQVTGMFYKAMLQVVLLFGSETLILTETTLEELEGFHIEADWRMALGNKLHRGQDGV